MLIWGNGRMAMTGLICAIALSTRPPLSAADHTETREFAIFIDGKDSGRSKLIIVQKEDGSSYMNASLEVKFRHFIADYNLKIDTQEWWKDGLLVGMKTSGAENSKKTDVVIANENNQLRIRVNSQDRGLKPETWTTSFWKLADARFHNKQIPVVEVDTGKEFTCELKYVDNQQLKVGNELQECYHFRVTGGPGPVDLWFDRYHRIVRQELTEMGHKTIVQIVSIRR